MQSSPLDRWHGRGSNGFLGVALVWLIYSAQLHSILADDRVMLEQEFRQGVLPVLKQHCESCHRGSAAEAMLDMTRFQQTSDVVKFYQTWTEIRHRLAAREMPPRDAQQPLNDQQRAQTINWIDRFQRFEAEQHAGDPGLVPVRRLSNSETNYAIADLTGIDIRPTREFPVDPANEAGFDNSAESLSMSPALFNKYLAAAREVAEHLVLTPDGIDFAPHPVVTDTDRDKYCVKRIVDFYQQQRTDYADYFYAAWQHQHLPNPPTLETLAQRDGLSLKYLKQIVGLLRESNPVLPALVSTGLVAQLPETGRPPAPQSKSSTQSRGSANDKGSSAKRTTEWNTTTLPKSIERDSFRITGLGPLAVLRRLWLDLPASPSESKAARQGCEKLRDFVVDLRGRLEPEVRDIDLRGIHKGAQPFVLWKNGQYAAYRQVANLSALVKLAPGADSWSIAEALKVPEAPQDYQFFEGEVSKFCRLFPDAFYISERGRDYVGKPKAEQEKGRLLSAGFHSMMGYYRDDAPLMKLMLDTQQQAHLDRLWQELDFITSAPMRQYTGFVWFERTDSTTMRDVEFDFARAEDKSVTSASMIERLAETYLAKAQRLGANEVALGAIDDYFRNINRQIRWVEDARRLAEPHHLRSLLALAERAYRRPLSDGERSEIIRFYEQLRSREQLSHEEAIQDTLVSLLLSPEFCFRVELAAADPKATPLNDFELASRLSFFLWSSLPDAELLQLAGRGQLREPAVLQAQTRRMLNDPKISRLALEFGGQWLDFRRFDQINSVDRERFPSFDDRLRQSMFEEPTRFLEYVLRNDAPVLDCMFANYIIVDQTLAKHYGMQEAWAHAHPATQVAAAETSSTTSNSSIDNPWRLISESASFGRGGVLTMGAFLTQNAPGRRTSPVKRGYWVVRRLLGEHIPPPPPNVPELPSDEAQLGKLSLRETLAKHREHPSCAGCHNRFDSLGLVFESYGPIGERRQNDLAGNPVDTMAVFPSGAQGQGVSALRDYLQQHRQTDFVDTLSRKLLSFALGRTLTLSDEPLVAQMQAAQTADELRFSQLIHAIVQSPQFLNKRGTTDSSKE